MLKNILKSFLNLIYPLHCASCKISLKSDDELGVCDLCARQIRPNPRPYCKICGRSGNDAGSICPDCSRSKPHFDMARSACLYEGALKELIHSFKYGRKASLAKFLSGLMIDFVNANSELIDGVDAIAYVPLENARARQRGFNQSGVLAAELANKFTITIAETLKKTKATKNQNELSRQERLVNLIGAFELLRKNSPPHRNSVILLIDDVMTTGATLNECAKVLKDSGAKEVRCLTLARGM